MGGPTSFKQTRFRRSLVARWQGVAQPLEPLAKLVTAPLRVRHQHTVSQALVGTYLLTPYSCLTQLIPHRQGMIRFGVLTAQACQRCHGFKEEWLT